MGGILGTSASERERKCDRADRLRDGDGDKAIMTSFVGPDSGADAVGVVVTVVVAPVPVPPGPPVPPVPSGPPVCLVAPASSPASPVSPVRCMSCICFFPPCSARLNPRDIDSTVPDCDISDGILDVSMGGMSTSPPKVYEVD